MFKLLNRLLWFKWILFIGFVSDCGSGSYNVSKLFDDYLNASSSFTLKDVKWFAWGKKTAFNKTEVHVDGSFIYWT